MVFSSSIAEHQYRYYTALQERQTDSSVYWMIAVLYGILSVFLAHKHHYLWRDTYFTKVAF